MRNPCCNGEAQYPEKYTALQSTLQTTLNSLSCYLYLILMLPTFNIGTILHKRVQLERIINMRVNSLRISGCRTTSRLRPHCIQSLPLRWEWCGSITFFHSKGATQEGGEQNDQGGALHYINTGKSPPQSSEWRLERWN